MSVKSFGTGQIDHPVFLSLKQVQIKPAASVKGPLSIVFLYKICQHSILYIRIRLKVIQKRCLIIIAIHDHQISSKGKHSRRILIYGQKRRSFRFSLLYPVKRMGADRCKVTVPLRRNPHISGIFILWQRQCQFRRLSFRRNHYISDMFSKLVYRLFFRAVIIDHSSSSIRIHLQIHHIMLFCVQLIHDRYLIGMKALSLIFRYQRTVKFVKYYDISI